MASAIRGDDLTAQVSELRRQYPELYACLDLGRIASWQSDRRDLPEQSDEFSPTASGGRGDEYVRAQKDNVTVRLTGIGNLMRLARGQLAETDNETKAAREPGPVLVDLLGGDGLIRRACGLLDPEPGFSVLTCDASPFMVSAAWSGQQPALLQRAERQLLRSCSVDVVLLAYGSHHISPDQRSAAVDEAYRVLRPGGVFLLHDFLVGSATERWFGEVVDRYSITGHQHTHYTESEIVGYLGKAGFEEQRLLEIEDPYTTCGPTQAAADARLGKYLLDMYGLVKVSREMSAQAARDWALAQAQQIFLADVPVDRRILSSRQHDSGKWWSTIPRRAVVGIGQKLAGHSARLSSC